MKNLKTIYLLVFALLINYQARGQSEFDWPESPASDVFQEFVSAYNTGDIKKIETFVRGNYSYSEDSKFAEKTEYWTDIYYRFGPVEINSISINKPYDLEIWLQGTISKAWFAPEFILDKETEKIKAVGMLLGEQPPGTITPADSMDDFISQVEKYLKLNEENGLFQGVVLIQHGDRIIMNKAFGLKNITEKEKNTVDTRMSINSVTKPITAVAVLKLIQNGQLNLNDPISKFLPRLPEQISQKITIGKLLTHTSGYELDGIDGFREELADQNTIEEVYKTHLKYLPNWELYKDFKIPERWDYSNDSFDLLAVIIERISGEKFEDFLKKNIFDPAEMRVTSFSDENSSTPYRFDLGEGELSDHSKYPSQLGRISGAAGLFSTTEDLKKLFFTVKNSEKILDLPHKNLFYAPVVNRGGSEFESYGLNISYGVVLNYGHAGINVGNSSELRYFPESDLLLIVLCNNRSGAPNLYGFVKNNLPVSK